ncbi:TetR family transcriptional regulator [Candidatus Bathyarchaeota archaeon]|jgi:AcrR family transcriptional regulator|nr:TetR family transcriptional regulator [Candidatus Bathyarchaeota archaeon]MBT4319195.1 TetR family transcriptional regulator [Candidatus Bathyarchaeota archaeon]MBT4423712.1 TetR family transcriptional regulator [Candidatus Bathyarchaeota archaeon]MBT5642741.1 TetR family transcriptional regulator [Candidatus Bathyarchaeota archaeon]MBT6605237.1 TetR family transcriptional regulator [Candidatus Bathyarchaeota archaeon]
MDRVIERDKDKKIQSIKQGLTDLIAQFDYQDVTIRQIAKRAGTSVGIIYHYFPKGKQGILVSIYEDAFKETVFPYLIESQPEQLGERFKSHLDNHRENWQIYRALDQAMIADRESFDEIREDRHRQLKSFATENGYPVEKIDAWITAYNVIDALIHRHLFVDKITKSDQSLVELIQKLYSSIMGG